MPGELHDLRIHLPVRQENGMDYVTITDHNNINGALETAHLPDVFISMETSTYLPENGCKLHLITLDITEADHREIMRLRKNVYELAEYIRQRDIAHSPVQAVRVGVLPRPLEGAGPFIRIVCRPRCVVSQNSKKPRFSTALDRRPPLLRRVWLLRCTAASWIRSPFELQFAPIRGAQYINIKEAVFGGKEIICA